MSVLKKFEHRKLDEQEQFVPYRLIKRVGKIRNVSSSKKKDLVKYENENALTIARNRNSKLR